MAVQVPLQVLVFVAVLAFLAGYGYRQYRTFEPPPGPVESYLDERRGELRERFASGHISREQFAAEIETVEDPATREIMHLARDVDGIGPHIAFKIARKYDGLEDLARADVDELTRINRVGENRARGVVQRASRER